MDYTVDLQLVQHAKDGNEAARTVLLARHSDLVACIARRHHRAGAFLEMDDLIQQGSLGILHAIEKFDLERRSNERPVQFATYASYWIEHSIRRTIQNQGYTVAIPVSVQRDLYAMACAARQAHNSGERISDPQTLASAIGLTERRWQAVCSVSRGTVSMDTPRDDDEAASEQPFHAISSGDDLDEDLHEKERHRQLRNVMDRLSPREREVLEKLYGFGAEAPPKSNVEVGRDLGLSPQRIGQLKKRAVQKLRALLAE